MTALEARDLDLQFLCLREQVMSSEEFESLQRRLTADAEARRRYIDFSIICAILRQTGVGSLSSVESIDAPTLDDTQILPALREVPPSPEELGELPPEWKVAPPTPPMSPPASTKPLGKQIVRRTLAAALILGTSFAAWLVFRGRSNIASITATADVKWEDSSAQSAPGIAASRQLNLAAGAIELTFKNGAAMTVAGPASLTVDDPKNVTLQDGSLSARVPPAAHGFCVTTPVVTVTDLGTAFGMKYDAASGRADVDVFEGKVLLATVGASTQQRELQQGMAAHIVDGVLSVDSTGAQPQLYVRKIDQQITALDVVDLISGGDGTTGRVGGMIDPGTGKSGQMAPVDKHSGGNVYCRVPSIPVIDGCTIPAQTGLTTVDSAGHTIAVGPGHDLTFDYVYAGNRIPTKFAPISGILEGIDYSMPEHRLLFVHPNAVLTFDLEAIRRIHPGATLTDFRAVVGNSCVQRKANSTEVTVKCLMDGNERLSRVFYARQAEHLDIAVNATDHFFTIVTLSTSVDPGYQDVIFGDPKLDVSDTR
jgi:hypothetical protein